MLPKYSPVFLALFHTAEASQDRRRPPGLGSVYRQEDMNLDSHPNAQRDRSRDQCSMTVDDDRLAFAGQRFSKTVGLDPNLQAHPRASSGFTSAWLGGHYVTCLCGVERKRSSYQIRTPDDTSFRLDEGDPSDLKFATIYEVVERPLNE